MSIAERPKMSMSDFNALAGRTMDEIAFANDQDMDEQLIEAAKMARRRLKQGRAELEALAELVALAYAIAFDRGLLDDPGHRADGLLQVAEKVEVYQPDATDRLLQRIKGRMPFARVGDGKLDDPRKAFVAIADGFVCYQKTVSHDGAASLKGVALYEHLSDQAATMLAAIEDLGIAEANYDDEVDF